MGKRIDLTGQRFGRLVVEGFAYADKCRRSMWKCRCDCGKEKIVAMQPLRDGRIKSCGCEKAERCKKLKFKHGHKGTRLYNIWKGMNDRTNRKSSRNYINYGGRGISVCKEWQSFEVFYKWAMEHGYQDDLSIDRIDVNGNYCPENCRWANAKIQANNSRRNAKIEYKGQTLTLQQWAEKLRINKTTLWNRLNALGWSVEEALETPVGQRRKK